MSAAAPSLTGRTIVTTRARPGELDRLLVAAGATVVHVPLIEIAEPADGGAALAEALDSLAEAEWLIVTSVHGARRAAAAAAAHPHVRLAAVGTATAAEMERLAGRPIDLVPRRQTGADLLLSMPAEGRGARIVMARADRADPVLAAGLADRGYDVRDVIAYRTLLREPSEQERERMLAADAVAFASGSAARAWAEAVGAVTPPIVVAIGPTTARVAGECGLTVTHVAGEHDVPGLVATLRMALAS